VKGSVRAAGAEEKKGKHMKKVITILAVLAIGALAVPASAAPFVLVKMTTLDGESNIEAAVGEIVSYKITVELNDIGTVNSSTNPKKTITARVTGVDGIGACVFNVQQSLSDLVQLNFFPGALQNGYDGGLGASGGTAADRGNGYDNLTKVNAVLGTGVAAKGANAPVIILTGTFQVMEGMVDDESTIRMTYKSPNQSPGAIKYNNGAGIIASVANVDPYFGFAGLTVKIVPEPATLAVLGLGGVLLAIRRRR